MEHKTDPNKDEKLKEIVRGLAADFVQRESNHSSLVTVTNVLVGNRGKHATILFTVLPENKQEIVEEFLKRKRAEFQDYVRSKSRLGRVPLFDFEIDYGERNRQKADELLK